MGLRYFAYGSNMHADELGAWCSQARPLGVARLDHYRLDFRRRSLRWGAGVADLMPSPGASVWGMVYELAEEELGALDAKEGVARGAYRRIEVSVTRAAEQLDAIAYTVVEKSPEPIAPSPEYARLLLDATARCGLPTAYRADLEATLTRLVPDSGKPHAD